MCVRKKKGRQMRPNLRRQGSVLTRDRWDAGLITRCPPVGTNVDAVTVRLANVIRQVSRSMERDGLQRERGRERARARARDREKDGIIEHGKERWGGKGWGRCEGGEGGRKSLVTARTVVTDADEMTWKWLNVWMTSVGGRSHGALYGWRVVDLSKYCVFARRAIFSHFLLFMYVGDVPGNKYFLKVWVFGKVLRR